MGNTYKIYRKIVIIFSIITIFVCLLSDKGTGYEYITLIPTVYLIFFLLFPRYNKYSARYRGLFILNLLMFLKYVVTIFCVCSFEAYTLRSYYAQSISTESYHTATFLLIGEMFSIFGVVEIFSSIIFRKSEKQTLLNENHEIGVIGQCNYAQIKIGPVLAIYFILCLGLILMNPSMFLGKIGILFSTGNSLTETVESSNALDLLFNAFKILVTGIPINYFIAKFNSTGRKKYILYSYIVCLVFCLLNVSTSRINIIIPFLLFVLITHKVFKKTGVVLDIAIVFVLAIMIGVVSVYKMPYIVGNDSLFSSFIMDMAVRLQEYTSNVMPTAMGLQAIEYYDHLIGPQTIFVDILGTTPIISALFENENFIYDLYNQYALGGLNNTQIIPMTVSSIAYFSWLFPYLLVDVFVILVMLVDSRSKLHRKNYLDEYIDLYLCYVFAYCINCNIQMINGRFFTFFLAPKLIMYINRKIKFKVKR